MSVNWLLILCTTKSQRMIETMSLSTRLDTVQRVAEHSQNIWHTT